MNTQKRIQKLDTKTINQIAAGEVVERPASVIKELIENSIDANATEITIELKNGGKTLIKIIDNGLGLHKDDFGLVFERHATSKIAKLDDLESEKTLGFRGEALASIASISQIEFASNGNSIDENGSLNPKPMASGTQVAVKNLFYNTPARSKFLKTDQTEYKKCLEIIESYALAQPEVAFRLIHNEKQILNLPKADLKQRIADVLGQDFASKLLKIAYLSKELTITGFISKPELAKDRAYNQHLIVNGRPISAPYFIHAIKNAYGSTVFPQEKPPFVLQIDINPAEVDMNVHPRKEEARFHFQSMVYSKLMQAVKHTLNENILTPKMDFSLKNAESFMQQKSIEGLKSIPPEPQIQNSMKMFDPSSFEREKRSLTEAQKEPETTLKPIAQVANSYIICRSEDGLVIVDQHAAHERVMYEKLKEEANKKDPQTQPLLVPEELELSRNELETLSEAQKILEKIGFHIEPMPNKKISIQAIPAKFSKNDLHELIHGLLQDLEENAEFKKLDQIEDIVINYAACRGAIKFGQPLTIDEQIALISQMETIAHKQYSCPHGRPTMISLSLDDLEKEFKRRK